MTTPVENNTCTTMFIAQSRYGINLSVHQQMNGQKACGISSSVASDSLRHHGLLIHIYIYIHTMEYYSAIRKNAILPFVPTWLDLEDITVNEISQTEEHKNAHYHLYVES